MKNLKRLLLSSAILIAIISCEKDVEIENNANNAQSFTNNRSQDPIVIIECTPHRNSKDCQEGWGLCDCEFLPNAPWKTAINTDLDEQNNKMILQSQSFQNNGHDTLYVDTNLDIDSSDAQSYGYSRITILSGAYAKNSNHSVTVDVQLFQ